MMARMTFVYFMLTTLMPLHATDDQEPWRKALRDDCRQSGYNNLKDTNDPDTDIRKDYYQKSIIKIQEFLKDGPQGRLLILGPGPGNDLPLEWLINRFTHITMIDGDITPMRNLVEKLAQKNPLVKQKVDLIEDDLSGGIFKLLHDAEIFNAIVAIGLDFKNFCADNKNPPQLKNFLSPLMLDFARYRPDVIISSLTASAICGGAVTQFDMPISQVGARLLDIRVAQKEVNAQQHIQQYKNFVEYALKLIKASILKTYLDAIAKADAKMVYFSDTNTHNFDAATFDGFIDQFKENFIINIKNNVWMYRPNFPVSCYTFQHKSQALAKEQDTAAYDKVCANCHKIGELKVCSACKKIRYCSAECQKQDWPNHKQACLHRSQKN